jgi:hypothetical protein
VARRGPARPRPPCPRRGKLTASRKCGCSGRSPCWRTGGRVDGWTDGRTAAAAIRSTNGPPGASGRPRAPCHRRLGGRGSRVRKRGRRFYHAGAGGAPRTPLRTCPARRGPPPSHIAASGERPRGRRRPLATRGSHAKTPGDSSSPLPRTPQPDDGDAAHEETPWPGGSAGTPVRRQPRAPGCGRERRAVGKRRARKRAVAVPRLRSGLPAGSYGQLAAPSPQR